MTVLESSIETLNPGSARFGDPGELVVQRMRFQLKADVSSLYEEAGFGVHLDELVVVEAASITREFSDAALGDVSANNYLPVIQAIQADSSGNKAKIQLYYPETGARVLTADNVDLSGNVFMLDVEGY